MSVRVLVKWPIPDGFDLSYSMVDGLVGSLLWLNRSVDLAVPEGPAVVVAACHEGGHVALECEPVSAPFSPKWRKWEHPIFPPARAGWIR